MQTEIIKEIKCIDHAVSKEEFYLKWDADFKMYRTTPQPSEADLNKYYDSDSYISHTDSKASFIDKLYQTVKNFTIKKKIRLIESFEIQNKTILDIGCGTGDFVMACKRNSWTVSGIEPNDKARKLAELKLKEEANGGKAIFRSIEELVKINKKYDVITMWHVLEHIPNLEQYINLIKNLLNPGGTLVIAVPNFMSFDANHYKTYWAGFDVPRHLWHFSKESIKLLFESEKYKLSKVIPMKFDSFYVSLLSEKYKTGKSNLFKAFLIGALSNLKAASSKQYSSLIYIVKCTN